MFQLNYDPTLDSGFVTEETEAQYFSFKYSCREDKGRKWKPSQMKSQGSPFRDGGRGGGCRQKLELSGNAQVGRYEMLTHISQQTKGFFL